MKRKNDSFEKGFTLIEMLIVALLMFIMTGALFMNQKSNSANADADSAARQIATQLRSLQNDALNGKTDGTSIACRAVMRLPATAPSYNTYDTRYYDCKNNAYFGIRSFNLGSVWIDFEDSPGEVNFSMPDGRIEVPVSGAFFKTSQINLVSQKRAHSATAVCVYDSGKITEVVCPDGDCDNVCQTPFP